MFEPLAQQRPCALPTHPFRRSLGLSLSSLLGVWSPLHFPHVSSLYTRSSVPEYRCSLLTTFIFRSIQWRLFPQWQLLSLCDCHESFTESFGGDYTGGVLAPVTDCSALWFHYHRRLWRSWLAVCTELRDVSVGTHGAQCSWLSCILLSAQFSAFIQPQELEGLCVCSGLVGQKVSFILQ